MRVGKVLGRGLALLKRLGAAVRSRSRPGYLYPFWDAIDSAEFSPDGLLVLTTSRDETARIWDVGSGVLIRSMERSGGSAVFSPDGVVVVDGAGRMWEVGSGRLLHTLGNWSDCPPAFSPDGRLVVTGLGEEARIWDASTGRPLHMLEGHFYKVLSAAISSDSRLVATGDDEGATRIWEVANGRLLHTLEGHGTPAMFSSDGGLILTASFNYTPGIWDAASGRLLHTLECDFTNTREGAAFSPDSKLAVTAGIRGSTALSERLLAAALKRHS